MRNQSTRAPWAKALSALLLLPMAPSATAENDAAHRLAETFAGPHAGGAEETEAKARGRAQREEDMRRAAEATRRAFEAQRAARQRQADEADMLARARAEAAEEQARRAAETQREEEARDLSERLRQARDADAERAILEAEAKADARRAEPLDESSIAQPGFAPAPEAAPDDQHPARDLPSPSSDPQDFVSAEPQWPAREPLRGPAETRTTVLLVLEPGSRGIRRWNKTADPMLCVGATCYVSTGAASPATALTRAKAFGPGLVLGGRAGACRNALGCVFRGIPLDGRVTAIQPIDLRLLRHDRREVREAVLDETCRLVRGALACRAPVRAETYRAWIVPERLAERSGPEALAAAVASGLPDEVSGRD
jgi:hypothetical protein